MRMKLFIPPIDLTNIETLVYHLPQGPTLKMRTDGIEDFIDLDLEIGEVCDTSDIDGVVHFFPRGIA